MDGRDVGADTSMKRKARLPADEVAKRLEDHRRADKERQRAHGHKKSPAGSLRN